MHYVKHASLPAGTAVSGATNKYAFAFIFIHNKKPLCAVWAEGLSSLPSRRGSFRVPSRRLDFGERTPANCIGAGHPCIFSLLLGSLGVPSRGRQPTYFYTAGQWGRASPSRMARSNRLHAVGFWGHRASHALKGDKSTPQDGYIITDGPGNVNTFFIFF